PLTGGAEAQLRHTGRDAEPDRATLNWPGNGPERRLDAQERLGHFGELAGGRAEGLAQRSGFCLRMKLFDIDG
ncbi:hypothetical protein RA20_22945, partial [Leisingera sp. ANG-Vp]